MRKLKVVWGVAVVYLLACASANATIIYLGSDTTTEGAWRSTNVTKPAAFDPNGNNAYGSDGNYMYYNQVVEGGNTELLSNSPPSYAGVSQMAANKYSNPVYTSFDDPTNAIGANVDDAHVGFFYDWAYGTAAHVNLLNITLTSDANFVLGALLGGSSMTPSELRVLQTVGGSAEATANSSGTPATLGGRLDYYFFNISGVAGDQFVVSGVATNRDTGITGITFETAAAPEPSTLVLATCGLVGLLAYVWRKRK